MAIGDFFTGFVDAARTKTQAAVQQFQARPTNTTAAIGSSIFEAIYQYGRGRIDLARERVGAAVLQSPQGQAIVQEVEQQRLMQWLPIVVIVAGLLFLGGFLIRR